MIAQSYITEWSERAPWSTNVQVEQDLIICRALCSIYQDAFLAELTGTKLRAVYQRRKGRDLFDLLEDTVFGAGD